jgi:hypothetical protein
LYSRNKQIEIMRTAKDLKIGDTFKKQGFTFTVATIEDDKQKNGIECVNIMCYTNNSKIADSHFNFKLTTKI